MIRTVIIEDDPMVAEINRRYLEQIEGFELVGMVGSVDAAITILKKKQVDLILLDIYMPGDTGWSLLSTIRGEGTSIDVIIITASCDKESIKKGLRFGAADYLVKPFEFDRFQSALQSYRKEQTMINDQEKLNQVDIDQIILKKDEKVSEPFNLPKGLTKNTLRKVLIKVTEIGNIPFSTEELVCKVGISRISMRKYVSFLADIHILETNSEYGAVGRPVYMHRLANDAGKIIDYYSNNMS